MNKYNLKYTSEEFIEKAKSVHGDKYNYSQTEYFGTRNKVKIICPEHGVFYQRASSHLAGNGCPLCKGNLIRQKNSYSQEEFLEKAKANHGNKYDYSRIKYVNMYTKIEVVCPIHGPFFQLPYDHLRRYGCKACSNNKLSDERKSSLSEFTQKANNIHNNKYDYSKVKYKNNKTKVEIICPVHGTFFQSPHMHLQGQGCPKCTSRESPQELEIRRNLENLGIRYFHNYIVDERYPWHVDIYLPERDLFLEYNGYYTHGNEWYDKRKKYSKSFLSYLKSTKSSKNNAAISTFTERDVLKRKTAKKNNLNYVVLWNEQDIEEWFALGCPDGHDGDGMYTWKEKSKDD